MKSQRLANWPGVNIWRVVLFSLLAWHLSAVFAVAQRVVRVQDAVIGPGQTGVIVIQMQAVGDEAAVGFTLHFNPAHLQYVSIVPGSGAQGAIVNVNDQQASAGTLGITMAKAPGQLLGTGTLELLRLTMTAAATAGGTTSISIDDIPIRRAVADVRGASLAAEFQSGTVTLNRAPTATAVTIQVTEDTPQTITLAGVDPDQQTLTFAVVQNPLRGTLTGAPPNLIYTPATNVIGQDSFTFKVNDGFADSSVATVTLSIAPVNDIPTISEVAAQAINEDGTNVVQFAIGDVETIVTNLTVSVSATSTNTALLPAGSLVVSGAGADRTLTIVPAANQSGTATITISVTDADQGVGQRSFALTVNAVNDPPTLAEISNQTVNEGNALTFTAAGADIDGPASALTYTLVGGPAGATINASTGVFSWTPTEGQGPGSFTMTVQVTDAGTPPGSASRTFSVTVNEVNTAPTVGSIVAQTVNEGTTLTFQVAANDTDIPSNSLTFSLSDAPAGASINPATGLFSWTPTEAQGPATISVTVVVQDNGTPALSASTPVSITVSEVNTAPTLSSIGSQTVTEGQTMTVSLSASDADIPANALTFSLGSGAPAGVSVDANGTVTWTPTEAQGPGNFEITVQVQDNGSPALSAVQSFSVTVLEGNSPPVIGPVGPQTVAEGAALNLTIGASDPDLPPNPLTFTLQSGPPGASLSPAGAFSWTPTEEQGPGSFPVTVQVSDGVATATQNFTITVTEANLPPVLASIGAQTIVEGAALSLNFVASDPDLPPNPLTFTLQSGPPGASLSPAGAFSWTPTEEQGPGSFPVTVQVSDGVATATQNFTITVTEANVAPVLATIGAQTVAEGSPLSVTATALDADLPPQTLSYSLGAGAPAGATINPTSGVITWTPTEAQGPGTFNFTVQVADNATPPLSASQSFTVTVLEVNAPPVFGTVGAQTANEGAPFSLTLSATDPDLPANSLIYGMTGAPPGATIEPSTGAFSWTPAEDQGPGTYNITITATDNGSPPLSTLLNLSITVNEVNQPPVLPPISGQSVKAGETVTFTAAATDPDLPAQPLTYRLGPGAPAGAAIDPSSGAFSWTPTAAQAPSTNSITIQVSDNATPSATASQTFTVAVAPSNNAPVLAPISDQTASEDAPFQLTVVATDSDLPANVLTYAIEGGPVGMVINPATGVITWTPTEADAPGTNRITVRVTDNGTPPLNATQAFTLVANEVNAPPVLAPIGGQNVLEGNPVTLTASATDPDLPANVLRYSLEPGAPAGASINPATGAFSWTPPVGITSLTNQIGVRVTDNGAPPLSAVQNFTVVVTRVNTAPVLAPIPPQSVNEGGTVAFRASATDADIPPQPLTYSLGPGAPGGATINPTTGEFSWTPFEPQGPSTNQVTVIVQDNATPPLRATQTVTIIVNEVNSPPVLADIPSQTVGFGGTITVRASAADPDLPANRLTFSLGPGAPAGSSIDPATGVFSWAPSPAQAGSTNQITIRVTDDAVPPLSDSKSFTIIVRSAPNQPPTISSIANQNAREGTPTAPVVFTVNDPDTPPELLTVTGTSSNPTLIPDSNITFGGSGTTRTVTLAPVLGQVGNANITVTVSDNAGGRTNTTFSVSVTAQPPVITRQPEDRDAVAGGSVSLSVTATGSAPLTYQWFLNGAAVAGATNATLELNNIDENAEGTYTVQVRNALGEVTSRGARVSVAVLLRITKQPVGQTVLAGANVTLVATASGRGPLSYQWRLNGVPVPGATGPSLVLNNVQPEQAGDYTVTVSNATGQVTSNPAKLVVNAPVTITAQPQSQTALLGTNVVFSVTATGTPPLRYQWRFNGSDLPGQNGATLTVSGVQPSHAGTYDVVVSNAGGSLTSAGATLVVNVPPVITRQPQNQVVLAGSGAAFSVVASGTELQYQWQKDGAAIAGATGPSLSIPSVQATDQGSYTVIVRNGAGQVVSQAATLSVNERPAITAQPQPQRAIAGGTASFSVTATGTAPLGYQWRRNGVPVPGATQATLNLSNVQAIDAGTYSVVVQNAAGPVTSEGALLTVVVPPTIIDQPDSRTATVGASVSFTVVATGTAPLTYQWRKDGADIQGATSATLAIGGVTPASAGAYTVVVRNEGGEVTSAAATLRILVPPTIVTQPASVTVQPGTPVTFSVTATGDAPLTYQWKRSGINIDGATSASLTIPSAQVTDAGSYSVVVQNEGGAETSASATLGLILPPINLGGNVGTAPPLDTDEGTFDGGSNEGGGLGLGGIGLNSLNAAPQTGESRWLSWRAPATGIATFKTVGSTFDTVMTVYTGAIGSLTEVASDDDRGGFFSSEVTFNAVQGTTYHINIEGFKGVVGRGAAGRIVVSFKLERTTDRIPVITRQPQSQAVTAGSQVTLTVEAAGTGLTYQWFGNGVALPGATNPTLVLTNIQEAQAQKYTVRVTSGTRSVESNPATVQVSADQTRSEDKFKNAPRVGAGAVQLARLGLRPIKDSAGSVARGYSGAQVFNTFGATKEQGEPNHADEIGGASQWFTYVAPRTGTLKVSTEGSNFDTVLAVYTGPGTDFETLKLEASDNNSGADGKTSVLTLPVVQGTTYYIAVDGVKGASGIVKLNYEIGVGPVISQQPQSRSVVPGTNVVFLVQTTNVLSSVTTNVPVVRYQWLKDGLRITGQTNQSLLITNVQPINAGNYAVVVSNFAGASTSVVATLTVNVPLSITTQPQSATVRTGSRVVFSVAVSGTPPVTFQWKKDGVPIVGATNATYELTNAQPALAGTYQVTASNGAGPVDSQTATLTVGQPPVVEPLPATLTVVVGGTVTLRANATGAGPFTYQWRLNGVDIPGQTASSLVISNAQVGQTGDYTVVVSNATDSTVSTVTKLSVSIPLAITADPVDQVVPAGGSALFSVSARGSGNLTYQWRKDNQELPGETRATLTRLNVQPADAGRYSVLVRSDGQSVVSAPANLVVNTAPVITQQPRSQVIYTGSTLQLSVTATGSDLTYQWLYNGFDIETEGAKAPTLVLPNANDTFAGNYSVIVRNAGGEVISEVAVVTVRQIVSEIRTQNGVFQFRLNVPEGRRATVQFSDNMLNWSDLSATPYASGVHDIEDPQSLVLPRRFYRLIIQ